MVLIETIVAIALKWAIPRVSDCLIDQNSMYVPVEPGIRGLLLCICHERRQRIDCRWRRESLSLRKQSKRALHQSCSGKTFLRGKKSAHSMVGAASLGRGHLAAAKAEKGNNIPDSAHFHFRNWTQEINDAGKDFSLGENDRASFRDLARLLLVV